MSAARLGAGALDVSGDAPSPTGSDGLTFDAATACAHLLRVDPQLASVIEIVGPYAVAPTDMVDPIAYLVRSIVYQQLNGTAAGTIHRRLLELFDGQHPTPEELLGLDVEQLRAVGVSRSKAASLHDLARHALDGSIPAADELRLLHDADIVARLTVVRGIGPWTVHMLLLGQLGRPDVLPTGDFGVREGFRLLHGLDAQPTPTQLRVAAEAWRPYRSVASWYLWRAVDVHREGGLSAGVAGP